MPSEAFGDVIVLSASCKHVYTCSKNVLSSSHFNNKMNVIKCNGNNKTVINVLSYVFYFVFLILNRIMGVLKSCFYIPTLIIIRVRIIIKKHLRESEIKKNVKIMKKFSISSINCKL